MDRRQAENVIPNGDLISAFDEEASANAADGFSGKRTARYFRPVRERNVFSSK
jgi:hypothetical protein